MILKKVRKSKKCIWFLPLALFIWAYAIEPRWVAHREISLANTGLATPSTHGLKVALTSDWHFTKKPLWRVMTIERAQKIVAEINASKPDIIIIAGDLIADRDYKPTIASSAAEEIAIILGQLNAKHGVYVTLGNHDWWFDGDAFTRELQAKGLIVLENKSQKINGLDLWVSGFGDALTGHEDPALALQNLPNNAPTIIAMHDPGTLKKVSPNWHNPNAIFVAGHTHGGQVYLPFYGAPVVPATGPREWAHGWVQYLGKRMYVTSGLGVSILPVRFNMRPEWVTFTL
jgi:uncharacterized protein